MTTQNENKDTAPKEVEAQPQAKEVPAETPQLPEGWGLNLEQFRGIIAVKHKDTIAEDDPILMVATLVNIATFEFDKMLKKHELAVKRLFIEETQKYLEVAEEVSQVLSSASAKAATEVFRRHSLTLNTLRTHLWWMIGIVILTTLVHLAAVLLVR